MTENTLCLCYKDQLFRKITAVDSGNYMKNFAKKRDKFLIVNAGVACICYCGFNAVLFAQRKLELLNYKR
jgi:hypothetical protein